MEALLGAPPAHKSPDAAWRIDQIEGVVSVTHIASQAVVLEMEAKDARDAAFSSDNRLVALRSDTGTRIWSLDGDYYAREVCHRLRELERTSSPSKWDPYKYSVVCSDYYKSKEVGTMARSVVFGRRIR